MWKLQCCSLILLVLVVAGDECSECASFIQDTSLKLHSARLQKKHQNIQNPEALGQFHKKKLNLKERLQKRLKRRLRAFAILNEINQKLGIEPFQSASLTSREDQVPPVVHYEASEQLHAGPSRIPCIIHQTWKTHSLMAPQKYYAESWSTMNPGCEYYLWNDTEIAALAMAKSPDIIWPVWEGFTPVEKADIFRYLVLWSYGGYYADADVEPAKPIAEWEVPQDTSLLVGYEFGHRFPEWQRAEIKFGRTEQFQQWFIVSAPQNPVLLRCLQMIRERFTWKIQSTLDLTGPGEIGFRKTPPEGHYLSYPSEALYGKGDWKVWVCAAGRVNASPQVGRDDPNEGREPYIIHHFAGSWKTDKDRTPEELAKMGKKAD
eukprot:Skav230760  [mRNA]  locus=scaffold4515:145006:146322:+ [translate_table: standard]